MIRFSILLSLTVLCSSACLGTSRFTGKQAVVTHEDALRERAAFEMQCNPSTLEVVSLGDADTAGVTGCGQRALYKFPGSYTGWLANTVQAEKVNAPTSTP